MNTKGMPTSAIKIKYGIRKTPSNSIQVFRENKLLIKTNENTSTISKAQIRKSKKGMKFK
jgi:hypothetical protein